MFEKSSIYEEKARLILIDIAVRQNNLPLAKKLCQFSAKEIIRKVHLMDTVVETKKGKDGGYSVCG